MTLKGENIYLRALEPADIDVLYLWENDTENWLISNTQAPFSRFVLEQYITSAHQDIYTAKQLRLIICTADNTPIGSIDLFDFDPNNLRAGIGILIADKENRGKGFASEALILLTNYCFQTLNLHQVYCNIAQENYNSIALFQKQGFLISGTQKQWIRTSEGFQDELFLQKIRK